MATPTEIALAGTRGASTSTSTTAPAGSTSWWAWFWGEGGIVDQAVYSPAEIATDAKAAAETGLAKIEQNVDENRDALLDKLGERFDKAMEETADTAKLAIGVGGALAVIALAGRAAKVW